MDTSQQQSRRRRRLLIAGSVTAVLAAGALVAGITFGLFSSQVNAGTQTLTAGTVTLTAGATQTCTLTPGDVKPGDTGTCTFNFNYAGNPAWVATDITTTSTASTTAPPTPYGGTTAPTAVGLFGGSNPMTLSVSGGSGLSLTGGAVSDILLSDPSTPTGPGAGTVVVNWSLPVSAGNEYQGASATITVLVHAVQAKNNPMVGGVSGTTGTLSSCTQYAVCTTGLAWS